MLVMGEIMNSDLLLKLEWLPLILRLTGQCTFQGVLLDFQRLTAVLLAGVWDIPALIISLAGH